MSFDPTQADFYGQVSRGLWYTETDIAQVLIQHGADVTAEDNTRSTPLHVASSEGYGKAMELLLTQGADVNAQDGRHSTPLHLAVSFSLGSKSNNDAQDAVRLLLSHDANVDIEDDTGRTPSQIASSSGPSEITELLSNYQVKGE